MNWDELIQKLDYDASDWVHHNEEGFEWVSKKISPKHDLVLEKYQNRLLVKDRKSEATIKIDINESDLYDIASYLYQDYIKDLEDEREQKRIEAWNSFTEQALELCTEHKKFCARLYTLVPINNKLEVYYKAKPREETLTFWANGKTRADMLSATQKLSDKEFLVELNELFLDYLEILK